MDCGLLPIWVASIRRWSVVGCHSLIRNSQSAISTRSSPGTSPPLSHDDLQVEQHRPVLDVIDVSAGAVLDGAIAAHAVDLRPARYAGLLSMAAQILGYLLRELFYIFGLFRAGANHAHLSDQHVEELWQLVQREPADEGADRRAARVVLGGPACGVARRHACCGTSPAGTACRPAPPAPE